MRFLLFLLAGLAPAMAGNLTQDLSQWKLWSQRAETAPRAWTDAQDGGTLALSGASNASAYGGWTRRVDAIVPGQWYRLTAHYRTSALDNEDQHVVARLDWQTAQARRAGQPDYATRVGETSGWREVELLAPAPANAAAVTVELLFGHAPQATVYWSSIALEPVQAPAPRKVRIATVNLRPRNTRSSAESVARFVELVESRVDRADLIVLPEAITLIGTPFVYTEVAEPVPGPTTQRLGGLAAGKSAYLVAGILEREGATVYNTAVLIGRKGELVGHYRKVYLPREEIEGGITPGSDFPVFQTDFGRLGMMICWDVQYTDPARALALRRAEVIAMPIAGGNQTLAKARAIENQLFLVSSGYDFPSQVIDPAGEAIALAAERPGVAFAEIDLNRRYTDPWLGRMRDRYFHEVRLDLPVGSRP
jgi:predicted amidohydrolase